MTTAPGRKKRRWVRWTLALVVAAIGARFFGDVWRGGGRPTVSKETTRIVGPLRADGTVDYLAALNEQSSRGVTPENNATVLLVQAIGPGPISRANRESYFRLLGIAPLPEAGDYFITSESHMAKLANGAAGGRVAADPAVLQEQLALITKRPWSKQEYPHWAAWLAANEKPLKLVVKATRRPRRFDPLVYGQSEMLFDLSLDMAQQNRDLCRGLVARAMLRVKDGKADEAWADLLACHRLGRLAAQGPTVIEGLIGVTIEGIAMCGDAVLLDQVRLSAPQIARMRKDLAALPSMVKMAERMDKAERFNVLDSVIQMWRKGPYEAAKAGGAGGGPKGSFGKFLQSIGNSRFDWDLMLGIINACCDRYVEAGRKPTRAERQSELKEIDREMQKLRETGFPWRSLLLEGMRKTVARTMGNFMVALMLPSLSACLEAEDRHAMQLQLTELAFALAAYRAEHGSYPVKLAELVPKYITEIPKDMFNGADLHYRREGNGYLLYSVGSNGKDDGGKGYEDRQGGGDWDDLNVRMPAQAAQ